MLFSILFLILKLGLKKFDPTVQFDSFWS